MYAPLKRQCGSMNYIRHIPPGCSLHTGRRANLKSDIHDHSAKKHFMPVSPLVRELQISSCRHVVVHSGKQNCVIEGYICFEYLLRDKIFKPRVNLRFCPMYINIRELYAF
jgi:hypothetical protein